MSLPKRDGVQGRYYLIQKPDTNPEVLEHADQCIQDVLDGTAKENHSGYPVVVRNQSGTPFLPSQLLERYLSKLPLKGFPYADAVAFCDALRRLAGWCYGVYLVHHVLLTLVFLPFVQGHGLPLAGMFPVYLAASFVPAAVLTAVSRPLGKAIKKLA